MQLEFKATQQSLIRVDRQVPIATSGNKFIATDVEGALAELEARVKALET